VKSVQACLLSDIKSQIHRVNKPLYWEYWFLFFFTENPTLGVKRLLLQALGKRSKTLTYSQRFAQNRILEQRLWYGIPFP
jgi:hypothetical protein